jgi:hypothetical protein
MNNNFLYGCLVLQSEYATYDPPYTNREQFNYGKSYSAFLIEVVIA